MTLLRAFPGYFICTETLITAGEETVRELD
jgi:hypothetical protein